MTVKENRRLGDHEQWEAEQLAARIADDCDQDCIQEILSRLGAGDEQALAPLPRAPRLPLRRSL